MMHSVWCALLCGVLLLAGCASTHHSVVMQLPATQQVLSGAMSTGTGAQDVTLTSDDGRLACNGVSLLEYVAPGCESSGAIRLQCTDGRDINADWQMEDCMSGTGEGSDDFGNSVNLVIGRPSQAAGSTPRIPRPAIVKPVAKAPAMQGGDSYVFHVGGGYVAGFGAVGGANAIFTDAETGLVIARRTTLPDLPMALADVALREGQEVFVLLPVKDNAIRRIRVGAASGSRWQVEGGETAPAGLPVVDLDGRFVALTTDDGLIEVGRLLRYLQLALPDVLDVPETNLTLVQLRARTLPPETP